MKRPWVVIGGSFRRRGRFYCVFIVVDDPRRGISDGDPADDHEQDEWDERLQRTGRDEKADPHSPPTESVGQRRRQRQRRNRSTIAANTWSVATGS
jgi:hypothetical protein